MFNLHRFVRFGDELFTFEIHITTKHCKYSVNPEALFKRPWFKMG